MALSHDVNLPPDHTPVWPPGCATCGGPAGDRPLLIKPIGAQWHRALLGAPGKSSSVIQTECCSKCRKQMRSTRTGQAAVKWAAVVPAIIGAIAIVNMLGLAGMIRPFALVLVGFGLMVPVHLFLIFAFPAENLSIVRTSRHLSFQFRDRVIAEEFAELNGGAVS